MSPGHKAGGRVLLQVILALLGLGGLALVLLSTSRYGAGTFADAENYIGAARNLLAGKGYQCYYGMPYTQWPPLFPTWLAALGLAGVDPYVGARFLNAFAFGLIVFFSGRLFLKCTVSPLLAVAGTLSVLASKPLLDWSVMAASEPVYVLFVVLFALYLPDFLRTPKALTLIGVSVIIALACLQRYAGVSLIAAGVILIALTRSGGRPLRRLKHAAIFAVVSATPVVLWCLQNRLRLSGTPALGYHRLRLTSHLSWTESLESSARVVTSWLFPWVPDRSASLVGLGLALGLAGAAIILSRLIGARRGQSGDGLEIGRDEQDTRGPAFVSVVVIGLTYFGFIVFCGPVLGWLPMPRHLVPLYVPVLAVMLTGIDAAVRLPAGRGQKKLAESLCLVLCALWLQYPLRVAYHDTAQRMSNGAGGYATAQWQDSPLMGWLRRHPLSGPVYCNASDAVYFLTGSVTLSAPRWKRADGLTRFARKTASENSYLVWFHGLRSPWLYDLREILSRCRTEPVAALCDGAVYRCLGEGEPQVSGFYRFWSPRKGKHLFTADKPEMYAFSNAGNRGYDCDWRYEGVVFYVPVALAAGSYPVHCVRSPDSGLRFYTISEAERDRLLRDEPDTWKDDGIAFYAYLEKSAPDLLPVYRLRSPDRSYCFYTISESERAKLVNRASRPWIDEGIAWYAYAP